MSGDTAPSSAIVVLRAQTIRDNAAEVRSLYTDIDQSCADIEQRLKDARLPQDILDLFIATKTCQFSF